MQHLHLFCRIMAMALGLGYLACSFPAVAQIGGPKQGQLANGLTYFVDPAKTDDGKISFTLLVKVGDWQTLPDEQSVAHVVEHIVFASAHVVDRKGSVRSRLEQSGGVWGNDANAAATSNYSRYFVKLPIERADSIATGIDILYDWLAPRAISDEEIDRETKAVIEEIRRGSSDEKLDQAATQSRAWFPGHPFYDYRRDPIGRLSATPAGIRRLYEQWYEPQHAAVIVRGTADVDAVIAELEARLGTIPEGESGPPAADAGVLPVDGGHYVQLPTEGTSPGKIEMTYKYRLAAPGSRQRAKEKAVALIVDEAVRPVLAGLSERYGASMRGVGLKSEGYYSYPGLAMLTVEVSAAPDKLRDALLESLRLVQTLQRQGLAESDIEQARQNVLVSLGDRPSNAAERFEDYFVRGVYDVSGDDVRTAITHVTPSDINAELARWLDPGHRDIFLSYPHSSAAKVPDAEGFAALLLEVGRAPPIQLAKPETRNPAFIPFIPADVSPRKPTVAGEGFMRWTLPRSKATLLYRPSNNDRIEIAMLRKGGMSGIGRENAGIARIIGPVVARSGLAGLDRFELGRFLTAHEISLSIILTQDREGLQGSAPRDQWPLLLDLLRARLLHPLCRAEAFEEVRRETLDRADADASQRVGLDKMTDFRSDSGFALDANRLRAVDIDIVCREYLRMTGDTSGMVIVIEGNLEPDELFRSVSAAIDIPPVTHRASAAIAKDAGELRAGRDVLQTGRSAVANVLLASHWKIAGDDGAARLVAYILNRRISDRLRTVEKGTYDASVSLGFSGGTAKLSISFDTAPENVDRMIAAAKDELVKLGQDGPTADELATARAMAKARAIPVSEAAETWLLRQSLEPSSGAGPKEIRNWVARRIPLSRLHESVRLPHE